MPVLVDVARLATCRAGGSQSDVHAVAGAALVWQDDRIVWTGREADLPAEYADWPRESAGGRLVVPGLVDCHTHLPFGGWRADEFAERLGGVTYAEIARRGGGILATRAATQAASEDELADRVVGFLDEMVQLGVTTAEAEAATALPWPMRSNSSAPSARPTRATPSASSRRCSPPTPCLPSTAPAAPTTSASSATRSSPPPPPPKMATPSRGSATCSWKKLPSRSPKRRQVLAAGRAHGLTPKLHADQLSAGGGAELAAEVHAASADHLEHSTNVGIRQMADAGVVAVSLPLASLYLNEPPMDARRWLEAGCAVAVATDFNPGSAPSFHLPMAMTLACTTQQMTPAEVLKGATLVAARAIGMDDKVGSLEPGKQADFAVIDAPDEAHWLYHLRPNACVRTAIGGETVWKVDSQRTA